MVLKIIVAISGEGLIGKEGRLPWRIGEDMKLFRELTFGHTVIMGRKTFESIPEKFRPLVGRKNIVVSSCDIDFEGVDFCKSVGEALKRASSFNRDVFFIGGKGIYNEALGLVDELCISHVKKDYEGDVYFPFVDFKEWGVVEEREFEEFVFKKYRRKREG